MARKKKTPSDAKPDSDSKKSKAEAISGAVKDADFDTPDAAMADTSLEADTQIPSDEKSLEASETSVDEVVDVEVVEETDDAVAEDTTDAATDDADVAPDETKTEETKPETSVSAAPPAEQGSGFGGMVLGGVIAAVIGFGGAIAFDAAEWPVFGGKSGPDPVQTQLVEQTAELQASIESLTAQLEDLTAAQSEGQATDAEAVAALTARLDDLPTTSAELMPEDLRALLAKQKSEMDTLQANLDQMSELTQGQIASAQEQQEQAAMAEARAKARGALNSVRTALSTGDAYAAALPEIAAAADVPEVLQANADTGIPSADTLEAGFGDAARAALSASLKATAGDAPADRVLFFLKDQLGARSLTPQEGDDPNAVLSRVEAAAKAGDLSGAIETIAALPEEGQAALKTWADMATTRKDALAAFDTLSDALSAN